MADVPPSFTLTGTWINLFLYTAEVLVGFYYFLRVHSWKTRALLGTLFLLDTGGTVAVCQIAWVALLTPQRLESTNATFIIAAITSALSSLILQTYFAHRLWAINRNKILISFLAILITVELSCCSLNIRVGILDKNLWNKLNIVLASLEIATNVIIAVSLAYQLKRLNFLAHSSSTKSLVHRVMVYVIACGSIGVIIIIIGAVLFISAQHGFLIFFDCLGRIYALTILLNFILFYNRRENHEDNPQLATPGNFPSQWESRRSTSGPWPWSQSSQRASASGLGQVSRRPISALTVIHDQNTTRETFADGYQKPRPGPPFSVESLFKNSEEELRCVNKWETPGSGFQ